MAHTVTEASTKRIARMYDARLEAEDVETHERALQRMVGWGDLGGSRLIPDLRHAVCELVEGPHAADALAHVRAIAAGHTANYLAQLVLHAVRDWYLPTSDRARARAWRRLAREMEDRARARVRALRVEARKLSAVLRETP